MSETDPELRGILSAARTIAVVGLSDKPDRDSYAIAEYLQKEGYRIIPVNPTVPQVLGERSYPSIADIPPSIRIDIVDVFRRSDQVPPVVEEALARGIPTVWMQTGVAHAEAAARARSRGVTVIENRCIRVDHRRLAVPPVPGAR